MRGTVDKVLWGKGYGFIRDEEGKLRFMHANNVVPLRAFNSLQPGQTVEFDPVDVGESSSRRDNGLRATNVRPNAV